MATNKRYNPALQKMRLGSASPAAVDPALNTYVLMLLRSMPITGIDSKERPTMSALGEKHQKVLQALLRRACMHGHVPWNVLTPFFDAIQNLEGNPKALRVLHYLIALVLSSGSAGTPVPLLPAAGTAFTSLAVEDTDFEHFSHAWAIIGEEGAVLTPTARYGLRSLSCAARCALTTLPAGKENDAKAAQLVADLKAAIDIFLSIEGREHKSKKKAEAEIAGRQRAQAAALIATRAALPRRELAALIPSIAQLFTFASPLAVRHALATMCRVPSSKIKPLLGTLSAPLRAAFEKYASTGLLHEEPTEVADPEATTRAHPGGVMALTDWLARIYLARLLCKLVFAGAVGGPQKQFLWRVLLRLAFSQKEKPHVRLEVWKAMFGEVLPQALSIFPVGNPSNTTLPIAPFSDATEQQLASFKATAWKVSTAALLPQANEGGRRRKAAAAAPAPEDGDESQDKFTLIVHQLLKMLESTSAATVCGGARALRCIAEARAHAVHASGDEYSEEPRITDLLANEVVPALRQCVVATQASAVKLKIVDALLWLHLPSQPTVTPVLMRSAVHLCTPSQSPIAGYSPWPPSDISAVMQQVDRRMLTAPELTGELLTAVSAMAAGAPSSMLPTALLRLWTRAMELEMEVGVHNGARDAALQAAIDLLAAPAPSMCSPAAGASPFEIAIGMKEWHSWSSLKDMAVSWLGEHANHCTDELAWYPPPAVERKAPSQEEQGKFGEPEMLGLMAMRNPRLLAVISQLQRAALAGSWQLRFTAVHALGKVAVKSEEPFRFHCYCVLNALAGNNPNKPCDVLGLTTTVAPIIRVLDKMYAGQMVMKQYCDAYGLDWSKWHPEVFESVQRRHESLVAEVRQVLTLDVPEGAFFPLGIKSQILLTGEGVAVDAEAQALVQEAAIAKAEAKFAEKQRLKEMELAGEALDAEEAGEGAFEDEAASTERTDSAASVALETITIEESTVAPAAGGSTAGDAGGFMRPDFDPFDPKAWEEQDPMLFAGVSADPEPELGPEDEPIEEIAISTTLELPPATEGASSSTQAAAAAAETPSAAAAAVRKSPLGETTGPQIAAVGSTAPDSDDETVDASAALQSLQTNRITPGSPDAATPSAAHTPGGSALQNTPGGMTGSTQQLPLPPGGDAGGQTFADVMPDPGEPVLAYVVHSFQGEVEGELTVHEGEEVYILDLIEGGWAQVQLISTGEIGIIPEWAAQEMDQQLAGGMPPGSSTALLAQSSMISRQLSGRSSTVEHSGALQRTTSTPRPAPAPGQAMTPSAASASLHRRRGSVTSTGAPTDTPVRNPAGGGAEDNPFSGGRATGQPVDDNPFGLLDMGGGGEADTAQADAGAGDPFGGGADPFGLDSLMGGSQVPTAPSLAHTASVAASVSVAAAATVAAADGEEGAEEPEEAPGPSAPAIDPAFVLDTSVSSTPANTYVAPSQKADDNPFGASQGTPSASDNPFGKTAASSSTPAVASTSAASASAPASTVSQNPFGTNKVEE